MLFPDLNLTKPLLSALDELGYIYPTPIQIEAFPIIMSGRDVVGVAQTGTGKTFAYLLPLLRLSNYSKDGNPRVLIVVPTRELALQVADEIEKLTAKTTLRVGVVYGGTNINTQKFVVLNGLDILVGTPGRLTDLVFSGALKFKAIRKLVVDEVDEMLNLGFRTQLNNLFDLLPNRRQNLLFSATMTEDVKKFIDSYFNHPELIEIAPSGTPIERIAQSVYFVPNFYTKVNLLRRLLQEDASLSKVLIFCSTKKLADRLFGQLEEEFAESISIIHSNKSQNYRIRSVENFKSGASRILIATDIIARGMDILEVSHVINFDMPNIPTNYIHRIGRTGRADKDGIAISFATEIEQSYLTAIEELMGQLVDQIPLPEDLEISTESIPEEIQTLGGDKNYRTTATLDKSGSKGAFHNKKEKNLKTNQAQQKRRARMIEKKKSKRRKKK